MESQVFYRKWRPQTLSDVVGQEHITQTLCNSLESGKVAHAYVFCGPRGTGKTSTGRILAKALNCLQSDGKGEPCNSCDICMAITKGQLLDVIEIDAASNRGIDEIREIRERVNYAPSVARSKVYIIDEVHMLTDPASNALLKTLEEPPPHVVFVLATTEPHKMLATILSRCQRFDFRRLSQVAIVSKLMYICAKESIDIEPAAVRLIARNVFGSLRDAENLLEQMVAYYGDHINVGQVEEILGIMSDSRVKELVRYIVNKDVAAGLATVNSVARDGLDLKQFNQGVVEYLRGMLLIKSRADEVLDLTQEDLDEMKDLVKDITVDEILKAVKLFGQVSFRFDDYSPLPMELALVECSLPVVPQQTKASVSEVGKKGSIQSTKAVSKSGVNDVSSSVKPDLAVASSDAIKPLYKTEETDGSKTGEVSASCEYVQEHWDEFVQGLRGVGSGANLDAFLRSACEPVDVEGDTLVLGFYYSFHMEKIDSPQCRHLIEAKLEQKFGNLKKIRCILKPKAKQRAVNGHLVRAAMEMGAKITNVEDTDG